MDTLLKRFVSYHLDTKRDAHEISKAFTNLTDEEDRLLNSLNPVESETEPPTQTDPLNQVESPASTQSYSMENLLNQRAALKDVIEIVEKSYDEELHKNNILKTEVIKLKEEVKFCKKTVVEGNADYSKLLDENKELKKENKTLLEELERQVYTIECAVPTMKGMVSAGPSNA